MMVDALILPDSAGGGRKDSRPDLWYNTHIMRKNAIVAFALALIAGCGPDDGAADFAKGEVAFAARDFRVAAMCYGIAAEKNATNLTARVKLALVNVELGELPAAKAAAESALALDPSCAEARMLDGQIAYLAKDYARAVKDFDDIVGAGHLPAELRSQALAARAVIEIADGKFDQARLSLWRAVRLDRRNPAAWYHLGHLSRDTYRFEDAALEQFEMAGRLMKDPVRSRAIARETIPALRESFRSKIATKPGAANRDPNASAKLVSEGEALTKKDPKKAATKFAEAYAKDPLSYAAAWNYAKAAIAAAKSDNDTMKALTAFQDAIDQRPNSQETYRAAANAALNHGKPMRAEKFLSQALAHDPENKVTLGLYVQTLNRLGKKNEARLFEAYLKEL